MELFLFGYLEAEKLNIVPGKIKLPTLPHKTRVHYCSLHTSKEPLTGPLGRSQQRTYQSIALDENEC